MHLLPYDHMDCKNETLEKDLLFFAFSVKGKKIESWQLAIYVYLHIYERIYFYLFINRQYLFLLFRCFPIYKV